MRINQNFIKTLFLLYICKCTNEYVPQTIRRLVNLKGRRGVVRGDGHNRKYVGFYSCAPLLSGGRWLSSPGSCVAG